MLISMRRAWKNSRALVHRFLRAGGLAFLASCWVMVDAPDTTSPPAAFAAAARARARKSAPPWLKKRLSSAASVALRSMSGTSRSRTGSVW